MTSDELIYEGEKAVRLDNFLTESYPSFSRTYFEKVITQGHVQVNQKTSKKSLKLQPLDEIQITFPPLEPLDLTPIKMDIPILYEDDHLAIIYKHSGIVCHPAAGTKEPTLIHGLLYHFQSLANIDPIRPGLVHRLDKGTSGLMIIAKNLAAHEHLSNQFKARTIKKTYLALVHYNLEATIIDTPIGRSLKDRKKMAIAPTYGRQAFTEFVPLQHNKNLTLVQAFPRTGRTHQIRVHLQHLNRPIVGDPLYGLVACDVALAPPRLLLHAASISFIHPLHGTPLQFSAPLPVDFQSFLDKNDFSFN